MGQLLVVLTEPLNAMVSCKSRTELRKNKIVIIYAKVCTCTCTCINEINF